MDKVLFGFKNVYYSKITESGGTITYGTPKKFADEGAGGVSIALSPRGESFEKYADDVFYNQIGSLFTIHNLQYQIHYQLNDNSLLDFSYLLMH